METTELRRLFIYDQHANEQVFRALYESEITPDMHRLASHILNALAIWTHRIRGKESPFGVWDLHAPEELLPLNDRLHEDIRQIFSERFDPDREITYQNSRGEVFSTRLFDILFHLVNHGTHHRGQLVRMIREQDRQPPVTDYIFYVRKEN